MAFLNLSKLRESIESTITSFQKIFKGDGLSGDDDFPNVPSEDPRLAQIKPAKFLDPGQYSFHVVDADNNPAGFIEFPLPINPQNLVVQDIPSSKIKATKGGTAVFRNSIKYKPITIKGTTGLYPKKGVAGVSKTGQARGAQDTIGSEGIKNASGYESFQRLKNYFRAFYINTQTNPDLRLVFNNYKDGEFYIVELLSFTSSQDASNPLIYSYEIQLKVLGAKKARKPKALDKLGQTLADIDNTYASVIDKIDGVRAVFLSSQDILRQVDSNVDAILLEPLRRISMASKSAANAGSSLADVGPSILKKLATGSTLLAVLLRVKGFNAAGSQSESSIPTAKLPQNLEKAIASQGSDILNTLPPEALFAIDLTEMPENIVLSHESEKSAARELPRDFYEQTKSNMTKLMDNAADKFGLNSPAYDSIEDRVRTTIVSPLKTPSDREFEVLAAFEEAKFAINLLLTSKTFFKSTFEDRINEINDAFDNTLGLEAKQAVRELILRADITLEDIALLELGDSNKWIEIAELNNLRYPYIVQDRTLKSEGVLTPGDKLIIPQNGNDFGELPIFRDSPLLDDLTHFEKQMGIDLKMTLDGDLEITNTGDFAIVRGLDNAKQAIITKLIYAKGEIFEHPDIGVGLKVGSKNQDFSELRANLVDSLTSDPRFERLANLTLLREGNTLKVKFEIKFKNLDIPLPLELRV
jgi:hypothetical protein